MNIIDDPAIQFCPGCGLNKNQPVPFNPIAPPPTSEATTIPVQEPIKLKRSGKNITAIVLFWLGWLLFVFLQFILGREIAHDTVWNTQITGVPRITYNNLFNAMFGSYAVIFFILSLTCLALALWQSLKLPKQKKDKNT